MSTCRLERKQKHLYTRKKDTGLHQHDISCLMATEKGSHSSLRSLRSLRELCKPAARAIINANRKKARKPKRWGEWLAYKQKKDCYSSFRSLRSLPELQNPLFLACFCRFFALLPFSLRALAQSQDHSCAKINLIIISLLFDIHA